MRFTRWFRCSVRPARSFRPAVWMLEDRNVPSYLPTPGPATHLQVIVPESAQAGRSFEVTVEAQDASNQVATGYNGSVALSLKTADSGATVPGPYQFSASDHGVHHFEVTLAAAGSQTITAIDSVDSFTTGAATFVIPAPVATTLVVQTPEQAAVGVATGVTVEVLDQSGNLMKNFTGKITLTSSDSSATVTPGHKTTAASVPISYTFTAGNQGQHTFQLKFNEKAATTGTATTVSVSTTGTPSLSAQGSVTVYPATVATHLGVFAVQVAYPGSATPVVVEALNAANQVITGYAGTVSFTSTDTAAQIRATQHGKASGLSGFTYTFKSADAGKHVFWLTFGTTGEQTLTLVAGALTNAVDEDVVALPPKR